MENTFATAVERCEVCGTCVGPISMVRDMLMTPGKDGWADSKPFGPLHKFCPVHDRKSKKKIVNREEFDNYGRGNETKEVPTNRPQEDRPEV